MDRADRLLLVANAAQPGFDDPACRLLVQVATWGAGILTIRTPRTQAFVARDYIAAGAMG